jgi:adenylosuccinate synthase
MTAGAITRLDVLDDFKSIKICTGYAIAGKKVAHFPANQHQLRLCKPVYEELPGWLEPTSHLREFKKLPKNAKAYVKRLEQLVGVPMKLISIGPRREETIEVAPLVTVKRKRKG